MTTRARTGALLGIPPRPPHAFGGILGAMLVARGPLVTVGDALTFQIRWARLKPTYASIVADLERGALTLQPNGFTTSRGVQFRVEPGAPLRVAFLHTGILDNWEGVVYDPTDAVATAHGWRVGKPGEFTAPPNVRALFGGDLVFCKVVARPYYRCWFT